MKNVGTKLTEAEHTKFMDKCNECGETSYERVRKLILDYMNGENPAPSPKVNEDKPVAKAMNYKVYDDKGNLISEQKEDRSNKLAKVLNVDWST